MLNDDITLFKDDINRYGINCNGHSDLYPNYTFEIKLFTPTYLVVNIKKKDNYKLKYLKYKNKYLRLKNNFI